jgi:hypothetical protein
VLEDRRRLKQCTESTPSREAAAMDRTTGDLPCGSDDDLVLEVFNFTAFEI